MTIMQKVWFKSGYNLNQHGEYPEAISQEMWMFFIKNGKDIKTLITYFPFYKQGIIKAYNEKNK
jgi:hypothetical protein